MGSLSYTIASAQRAPLPRTGGASWGVFVATVNGLGWEGWINTKIYCCNNMAAKRVQLWNSMVEVIQTLFPFFLICQNWTGLSDSFLGKTGYSRSTHHCKAWLWNLNAIRWEPRKSLSKPRNAPDALINLLSSLHSGCLGGWDAMAILRYHQRSKEYLAMSSGDFRHRPSRGCSTFA